MMIYEANFAGHNIKYAFMYPETRSCFRAFMRRSAAQDYDIMCSDADIDIARTALPCGADNAQLEFRSLISVTARELLKYRCCVMHAVSFVLNGQAFLLTAPSGTGKTTQYLNWTNMHPGEITMISGDMPVIECRDDGSVWVHPSCWNGKENLRSDVCAPLAGIAVLEQGNENILRTMNVIEAVFKLFMQFVVRPENESEILALSGIIEQTLSAAPALKFVNRGDNASTEMLRTAFLSRLERD